MAAKPASMVLSRLLTKAKDALRPANTLPCLLKSCRKGKKNFD